VAKKLTSGQRQDLLKRYRGRIEHSARRRSKEGYGELWKRCIDLYRGRHFQMDMLDNEDRIAVNVVFATINVIAPSVAVNYPKVQVYSRNSDDDPKAAIIQTVVNYWWRHYKFLRETNLAVRDWLIVGHGWLKVGWRYVEQEKIKTQEELNAAANSEEGADDNVTPSDPNEPTANDPSDPEVDDLYEVVEDRPFVERVSPFDIYVDPEAKTLESAKWIAQKIVKPLEEVRQDERYRVKGRRAITSDGTLNPDWIADGGEPNDDVRRVTIYEFYDLQLGTMCVFPHSGEDFLLDPVPQPYNFGHPFVMLRNYEVPDEFYPMGDVEALEPLQLELDKTRSQMMQHRKKFNRKYLYNPEAFDASGAGLLKSDQDNLFVPVQPDVPLEQAVVPLAQTAIEPQLYQYSQDTEANMDRVSGVSEYQQGGVPEIKRTATEASMIQDAANARSADKIAQVELLIAEVGSRVVQLAQQYLTEDQVARLMGKNGHPIWVPYGREDIQGEYDFDVEAGSTQPHNESYRKNQALQLLQAMTPWAQSGLVNAQELLRFALTYGFQIKNPDEFMAQQQPQQEQQKSPRQSLVESLNYKDAPPDVQRQIEAAAGFQPSQTGGSSPAEKIMATHLGQQGQQGVQQNQAQQQAAMALVGHAHDMAKTKADQEHEHRMAMTQAAVNMESQQAGHQHTQEQQAAAAQMELMAALQQQAQEARYAYQAQNYAHKLGED
jgi:hypothetical protein